MRPDIYADGNATYVKWNPGNRNVNVSNVNLDNENPNWSVREAVSTSSVYTEFWFFVIHSSHRKAIFDIACSSSSRSQ